MQGDVARLEYGADAHGELLAAVAALLEAVTDDALRMLLARLSADVLERVDAIRGAAVGAHGPVWPENGLQLGERGFLIVEVGRVENGHNT